MLRNVLVLVHYDDNDDDDDDDADDADDTKGWRSAEQLWLDCGTTACVVHQCKDWLEERALVHTPAGSSASRRLSSAMTTALCGRSLSLSLSLSLCLAGRLAKYYCCYCCYY